MELIDVELIDSNFLQNNNIENNKYFKIENYIIEKRRFAKGSFSTIHLGYNIHNKIKVAVKKIEVENIHKLKKNIKREIDLHMKINHKNIVKLYDVIFDKINHVNFSIPTTINL